MPPITPTALGALRTDIGEKIYFQDTAGLIRETRYEYAKGFVGGDANSVIKEADDVRNPGAIAAVGSNKDAGIAVTLFYITKQNMLKALTYSTTTSKWTPLASLDAAHFSADPTSQIAALRFGDRDECIRIYYQDADLVLHELAYNGEHTSGWIVTEGNFDLPAFEGTSLACDKWLEDDGSLREVQFFYQDREKVVRSHFYLAGQVEWYNGYLHLPDRPAQCGLAAAAYRHLGYDHDVCRVFVNEAGGKIAEHAFHADSGEWKVETFEPVLNEASRLGACCFPVNNNPDIRLYYQERGGKLRGYNFQSRRWFNEHEVPSG